MIMAIALLNSCRCPRLGTCLTNILQGAPLTSCTEPSLPTTNAGPQTPGIPGCQS